MKKTTGLTIVVMFLVGIFIGTNYGERVSELTKGLKTEFRIAYIEKILKDNESPDTPSADAGVQDEEEESGAE